MRMASILRKVYISGTVDVNSLRNYYGGRKNRGVKPEQFRKAGGKIIRVCLQDLEKLGFVKISDKKNGRVITSIGQKYLDQIASSLLKNSVKVKEPLEKKVKIEKPKEEVENKE